jgi:hypothetical protein
LGRPLNGIQVSSADLLVLPPADSGSRSLEELQSINEVMAYL